MRWRARYWQNVFIAGVPIMAIAVMLRGKNMFIPSLGSVFIVAVPIMAIVVTVPTKSMKCL